MMKAQTTQRLLQMRAQGARRVTLGVLICALAACSGEQPERGDASWSTAFPGKADIYGEDSRRELNDPSVADEQRALGDPVAMVVSMLSVLDVDEEVVRFGRMNMSQKLERELGAPLCEEEAFAAQVAPGYCSAFLITPQLVATAGHCVNGHTRCERMGFAFGYALERPDQEPYEVPRDQFYRCESLIGRLYNPFEEPEAIEQREYWYDWAVIKLDRPVTDRSPVTLAPQGSRLERGEGLVMLGHPSGLPMKVTEGSVTSSDKERYFNTSLDVYRGNSGSPVFDAQEGLAHGVMIRGSGGKSFEITSDGVGGRCARSRVCEEFTGARPCTGNHALRVEPLHTFTRPDLRVSERHRLIQTEDRGASLFSFSLEEGGVVDFATVHLNAHAETPQDIRVILHHGGQSVEVMSKPRALPYGRWTMTTEGFNQAEVSGEWVIELLNEGEGAHRVEWAQVMVGHHAP